MCVHVYLRVHAQRGDVTQCMHLACGTRRTSGCGCTKHSVCVGLYTATYGDGWHRRACDVSFLHFKFNIMHCSSVLHLGGKRRHMQRHADPVLLILSGSTSIVMTRQHVLQTCCLVMITVVAAPSFVTKINRAPIVWVVMKILPYLHHSWYQAWHWVCIAWAYACVVPNWCCFHYML